MARLKEYTLVGAAADTAAFAALQAPSAGVALTLTGAAASISPPRELTLTSAANLSAITFVVTGKDRWGNTVTESIVGPNANTVQGLKVFASITSVTPSASNAGTVSVGFPQRVCSPWVISNRSLGYDNKPSLQSSILTLTGAPTAVLETTFSGPAEFTGEAGPVDKSTAIVAGTPQAVPGEMNRIVLTSTAGTSIRARFTLAGFSG